ncbi:MAG: DUF2884 family protein [Dokdonella sp.]
MSLPIQRVVLALSLLIAAPAFAAVSFSTDNCDIHSDYSLKIEPNQLVLTQKDSTPAKLLISNGTLIADGVALNLSSADRERVLGIERGVRDLEPDIKAIAREAVSIALEAVTEVSASFADSPEDARESAIRIQRSAAELDAHIAGTDTISEVEVEAFVGRTVSVLIGDLVGNITAQALKIAFSGDDKAAAELEARADGIDKKVEKIAEKRSAALEQRAEAMCPKFRNLQRLERELEVRLPNGEPLRLSSEKKS